MIVGARASFKIYKTADVQWPPALLTKKCWLERLESNKYVLYLHNIMQLDP